MLPKKQKLSRVSFPKRTEQKISWVGETLRIQAYLPPSEEKTDLMVHRQVLPRFAVVVPKRLSASAVMRNSFKRQVMDVIRKHMGQFQRLQYSKHVLMPKEHLSLVTHERLDNDVKKFLDQQKRV